LHAQLSKAQIVSAARDLTKEGDRLWDQGDYTGALDKFSRAFGLLKVPTIGQRQAECFEKLNQLVEASEKYSEISRLEPGDNEHFKKAVENGKKRASALRARLPKLEVKVQGERLDGAQLTVDGKVIPTELWGVSWPVNPGQRLIELVKGKRRANSRVTLKEKEHKSVTITLPPGDEPPVVPVPTATTPPTATTTPPTAPPPTATTTPPESSTSTQTILGIVATSLGGAALLVGGITGIVAVTKKSSLDETCQDGTCPAAQQDDVDSYNTMRTVSAVGLWTGGALAATGIILLLTAPDDSEPESEQATVTPWVGLGAAGIRGTF